MPSRGDLDFLSVIEESCLPALPTSEGQMEQVRGLQKGLAV